MTDILWPRMNILLWWESMRLEDEEISMSAKPWTASVRLCAWCISRGIGDCDFLVPTLKPSYFVASGLREGVGVEDVNSKVVE